MPRCQESKKALGLPVQSGRRLRDCHMSWVKELRARMPKSAALEALQHPKTVLSVRKPG